MTQVNTQAEPTPEFSDMCLAHVRQWEGGQLATAELLKRLNELSQQATASGHVANQARAEHVLGYTHHFLGNINASISHYDKSRRLFVRVGNRKRIATIDLNQGENYRAKGEFSRARGLYRSAYEAFVELGERYLQSLALTNEGWILLAIKDYSNARLALKQAFNIAIDPNVDNPQQVESVLCEILYCMAEIDIVENNPQNAWENGIKALDYGKRSGEIKSQGFAWRVLGDALTLLGECPNSEMPTNPDDYYRQAMSAFKEIGAEGEVARTIFSQAKSLAHRNNRLKSAQMFREAMVIFTRLGMTHEAVRAAEAQLRVI